MARTIALVLAAAAAVTVVAKAARGDGVYVLTPDNFDDIVDGSTPALVEFYAPSLEPEYEQVGSVYKRSDGVTVAKMDADAHGAFATKFGVTGFPTIKWFGSDVASPDDYSGARNAEGIVQFINERTGLAKTLPKEATNVQHLTDATFNSIVMDPTKSALVEFYAPWCGHCKNLAPTYKKLADAFAGDENVAIVAVDATENRATTEAYGVKGYPTLKWFPAGAGKEAVDYAAGRDLDSFVNFINEHAGTARTPSGGLLPTAGRVDSLDELAKRFMAASAEERASILDSELAVAGSHVDADVVAVYERAMKKVLKKGEAYVDTEIARLEKMLTGGNVSVKKATKFALKRNVLTAFQA